MVKISILDKIFSVEKSTVLNSNVLSTINVVDYLTIDTLINNVDKRLVDAFNLKKFLFLDYYLSIIDDNVVSAYINKHNSDITTLKDFVTYTSLMLKNIKIKNINYNKTSKVIESLVKDRISLLFNNKELTNVLDEIGTNSAKQLIFVDEYLSTLGTDKKYLINLISSKGLNYTMDHLINLVTLPFNKKDIYNIRKEDILKFIHSYNLYVSNDINAMNIFESILKNDSSNTLAWFYLGNLLEKSNNLEQAVYSYVKSTYALDDDLKAIKQKALADCVRKVPVIRDNTIWTECGRILKDHYKDESILCYERATHSKPGDESSWYNLGILKMDKQLYKDALNSFDNAINHSNVINNIDLYRKKGECLYKIDRLEEAFPLLNKYHPDKDLVKDCYTKLKNQAPFFDKVKLFFNYWRPHEQRTR